MRLEMETASLCGLGRNSVGRHTGLINVILIINMHIYLGIEGIIVCTAYLI